MKWGGRTQAISVAGNDNNRAIAATDNGGAFLTTDGGVSWTHLDGLPPTELLDVGICPTNSNIVIATAVRDTGVGAANNKGGIWRSSDGGTTWSRPTGHAPTDALNNPLIYTAFEVSFVPGGCNVYVGTNFGLATSTDGGASFSHLTVDGGRSVISVVAGAGGLVDVHTNNGHYRSTSGGLFSAANPGTGPIVGGVAPTGLPGAFYGVQSFATHSLAVSPFNTGVLYGASRQVQSTTDGAGNPVVAFVNNFEVYESVDSGATWTAMSLPPRGTNRVPFVFAVATNGSSTDYDLWASDGINMYRRACVEPTGGGTGSRCTGSSWVLVDLNSVTGTYSAGVVVNCANGPGPCTHNDPSDLTFNSTDGCPLYLASDAGIQVPLPPGGGDVPAGVPCGASGTWRTIGTDNGFDALEIYEVAGVGTPGGPYLYIGLQDNDLWASPDGGLTWPNNRRAEGLGLSVVSDGTAANTFVTGFGCFGCSNFLGNYDFSTLSGWSNPPNAPGTCSDVLSNWNYAAGADGVCDPIPGTSFYSLAPVAAGPLAAGGGQIYLQWDNGAVNGNRDATARYQLYASTDFGATWTAVAGATIPPTGSPLLDPTDATSPLRPYQLIVGPSMIAGSDAAGNLTLYQGVHTYCVDNDSNGTCEGGTDRRQVLAFQLTNTAAGATPTATVVHATEGFGQVMSHSIQFKSDKFAFAADPNNPLRILAADSFAVPSSGQPGMRQSTDGGLTWSGAATADLAMDELTRLATAGGRHHFSTTNFSGSAYSQVSALQFNPGNSQVILVGTEQVGVISSMDGGATWAHVCESEQIPRVTSFFFDNNANQVYASSYGRGVWTVDPTEQQRPVFNPVPPANPTANNCGPVDIGLAAAEDHCKNVAVTNITISSLDDPSAVATCNPYTSGSSVCGDFDRDDTTITWTATDEFGNRTTVNTVVTVNDTTPPELTVPAHVNIAICSTDELVDLGTATAYDECIGDITPTAEVISRNGVPIEPPIVVVGQTVNLGIGTYEVRWTASDGITESQDIQVVVVGSAIQASNTYYVRDRASVVDINSDPAAVLNSGTGVTSIGGDGASVGPIVAGGSVTVNWNGYVYGDITAVGSVTVNDPTKHSGSIVPVSSVELPAPPGLPAFPAPTGGDQWINPGTDLTLPPGSYGQIGVNGNPNPQNAAILRLSAGDYFFTNLYFNSAGLIVVAEPGTRIFASGDVTYNTSIVTAVGSSELAPVTLGVSGSGSLALYAPFTGLVVAPQRDLVLGTANGQTFTGSFFARGIDLTPDSVLVCAPDLARQEPPACSNGVIDGLETDVDCGGSQCLPCADGEACLVDDDCSSQVCPEGICLVPTCSDGVQNGTETGEDCGGSCPACPVTCNSYTYQAEGMWHSTGNAWWQGGWNIYSNGYISAVHDFSAGSNEITVSAFGEQAAGVLPHMTVTVNGVAASPSGGFNVSTSGFNPYQFTYNAGTAGPREIRVIFDNDANGWFGDRNLIVRTVSVDCP